MKVAAWVLGLLACAWAETASALEVRFFPAGVLHSYELDAAHGASSLLVHNIAIINDGAQPVTLSEVRLELADAGVVKDVRLLGAADLARAAAGGAGLQQSGMWNMIGFMFGGERLLPHNEHLSATPTLAPGEALLVSAQVFAYRGARDEFRVHVAGDTAQAEGRIAVSSALSQTAFALPLHGVWMDAMAPSLHSHHRWAPMEQFAGDFVRVGANGRTHRGEGLRFTDYYAYGQPIFAAAAGTVVVASDTEAEDLSAMRQRGESAEAYMGRLRQDQATRLARGLLGVVGNYVVIDHGHGEFSVYAHMKPGSVRVHAGQQVAQGVQIGQVGSSGNSTEPHLHFQVCDSADALMCSGIPPQWTGLNFAVDDPGRQPQSADLVYGAQ